ncbi:unnamed protein product [Caenorhabditis sp. 36 PRJEB53466]|nr:unnamed protein product [Caenorhabditis sp. 36 PRJEB53466]
MGKKKGKRSQNRQLLVTNSPSNPENSLLNTTRLEEDLLEDLENFENVGSVGRNSLDQPPKHVYQTVFMSHENVTTAPTNLTKTSNSGKQTSYHDLMDGGAYKSFHNSHQSLAHKSTSNTSKGHEITETSGAGDRILAGSRSISHRSLFSDNRSFGGLPKSRDGSRVSVQWDNFGDENYDLNGTNSQNSDEDRVRISREVIVPKVRSRTVSSSSTGRKNGGNLMNLHQMSTSQRGIHDDEMDVRTYHAGSEYLNNRLSKLSIHSNNDEFVLVGGHPPADSVDSRSGFGGGGNGTTDSIHQTSVPTVGFGSYERSLERGFHEDPGRSISQQSINREIGAHFSRSSSRHSVGTTSNTDDRLMLAARYSLSPEAEGLLEIPKNRPRAASRRNSVSSSVSDRVEFAEIPTLFSHPDDNFNDDEPGESFRPTSEHQATPTGLPRARNSRFSSSSSISIPSGKEPPKALLVTSALTPIIPKRSVISLSRSDDSIVLATPDTVQRATKPGFRPFEHQKEIEIPAATRKTTEMAVQTGDTIRLRQNPYTGDVLSERAWIPPTQPRDFEISRAMTASFVPSDAGYAQKSGSVVEIPTGSASPATSNFRNRLRHISDIYANDSDVVVEKSEVSAPSEVKIGRSETTWGSEVKIPSSRQSEVKIGSSGGSRVKIGSSGTTWGSEIKVPSSGASGVKIGSSGGSRVKIGSSGTTWGSEIKIPSSGASGAKSAPKPPQRISLGSSSSTIVIPKKSSPLKTQKPKEIHIPISRHSSSNDSGADTIRKHIPRGRIRDLADAFNRMDTGAPPTFFHQKTLEKPERTPQNSRPTSEHLDHFSIGDVRNGSSSSALLSSTQTLSQEDRRRSTSSSLQYPPHVFTRNTFLQQTAGVKPGDKSIIPTNVAMSTSYRTSQEAGKGDGFVSEFEKIPSIPSDLNIHRPFSSQTAPLNRSKTLEPQKFAEYSRKVDVPIRKEVPIGGQSTRNTELIRKKVLPSGLRAKTQEVSPSTLKFNAAHLYESRAVSGDLQEDAGFFSPQKPLYSKKREAFGRQTAEDLRQDHWSSHHVHHQPWTGSSSSSQYNKWEMGHHRDPNERATSSMDRMGQKHANNNQPTYTTTTEYEINNQNIYKPVKLNEKENLHHGPSGASSYHHQPNRNVSIPQNMPSPYSPPATEDAGSRITHHTSQTLQDDLFATEDSSIRGKIDRMFDFVESDDSRKTMRGMGTGGGSQASTDTIGTSAGIIGNKFQHDSYLREQKHPRRYESNLRPPSSHFLDAVPPARPSESFKSKMKSPDRRNTVTGSEIHQFDTSELEYSLSQYREMQREQLRRRLPSADEPQFFRSPLLSAPHAGQSMHAYGTKDLHGTPTAGEKVRFPSSSSGLKLAVPTALATSTPIDSPQSRTFSSISREVNNNINLSAIPPNDTFVSSISGVSAVDKHAEVMRKINRLSYMMENTQKQMSMNEAALTDAVKKGRRSQEIAAHRSILITRETLRLQRNELRRLHALSAVRRPPPPVAKELRGAVVFKNLTVQLNKRFVSRLTAKDDNSYSFVGLFKFGHQVEATELVPLRVYSGETTSDKLYFEKQIQFSDVSIDFMVCIEIYAMKVAAQKPVELSLGSSFANKCKSLMGPPQKKSHAPSTETAFKFRGRLILDRDAAGDRCLYLDDVTYPLEGTVMITTECSRLPEAFEVDFRGFLTMFHTISNMASWERYWAVLRRGIVFFWKYPDDEQMGREPKMQIDLTKCTNNMIEKCAFDLCPRSNSFAIEILVAAEESSTVGSVVEKKRVLLSADTPEMLDQWLFTLNQTLDVIRGPI